MQRTVKSSKVKIMTRDTPVAIEREIFNETDEKKIIKRLEKEFPRGSFMIIEHEITEDLYVIDDETFFKYATKVEKNKMTENGEAVEG